MLSFVDTIGALCHVTGAVCWFLFLTLTAGACVYTAADRISTARRHRKIKASIRKAVDAPEPSGSFWAPSPIVNIDRPAFPDTLATLEQFSPADRRELEEAIDHASQG